MRLYSIIITMNYDILYFHKYIKIEEILGDDMDKYYIGYDINDYENNISFYYHNITKNLKTKTVTKIKNLGYLLTYYCVEKIDPTYNLVCLIIVTILFIMKVLILIISIIIIIKNGEFYNNNRIFSYINLNKLYKLFI